MFGSDLILGTKEVLVERSRMFLPVKMTGCESGEKLYMFYSSNHDCIIIQSEKKVYEIGKKYMNADMETRENELAVFGDYFLNFIGFSVVDKQKRIGLGVDVCCEIGIKDSAFVVGCFDELRVYPNKDLYMESIQNKKKII